VEKEEERKGGRWIRKKEKDKKKGKEEGEGQRRSIEEDGGGR